MAQLQISEPAVATLKKMEGYRSVAYLDVAGVPTIGYGRTIDVHMGDRTDEPNEDAWLRKHCAAIMLAIDQAVTVDLSQNQADALCLWTYNVGIAAMKRSTLVRKLNQGRYGAVPGELKRWVHAGGRVVSGLQKRRDLEAELWSKENGMKPLDRLKEPSTFAGLAGALAAFGVAVPQAQAISWGVGLLAGVLAMFLPERDRGD